MGDRKLSGVIAFFRAPLHPLCTQQSLVRMHASVHHMHLTAQLYVNLRYRGLRSSRDMTLSSLLQDTHLWIVSAPGCMLEMQQ
jgi:hypothetical protein